MVSSRLSIQPASSLAAPPHILVTDVYHPDVDGKGNQVLSCDAEFATSAGSSISRVLPLANHLRTPPPTGTIGSCPNLADSHLEVGILDLRLRDDGYMVVGSTSGRSVVDEVVGVPGFGAGDSERGPKVLEWVLNLRNRKSVLIPGLNPDILFPPLDMNKWVGNSKGKEIEPVQPSMQARADFASLKLFRLGGSESEELPSNCGDML